MTIICHINDIDEQSSKDFRIGNNSYFAIKKNGCVYLYQNHCPHLGVELNWEEDDFLDADKQLIHCSNHGALFTIDEGQCVFGPCQGKKLHAVPFQLVDGQMLLTNSS